MNLPNKLTVLRIILVPFIVLFMLPLPISPGIDAFLDGHGMFIALLLFIVAALTDYFDGAIARRRNLVSNFGKFLDPIADKLLILSVLIAFVQLDRVHAVVPILFLFRDFVVTGVRLLGAGQRTVIAANSMGKAKTVSQIMGVILIMMEYGLRSNFALLLSDYLPYLYYLSDAVIVVALALSLFSAAQYVRLNRGLLSDGD